MSQDLTRQNIVAVVAVVEPTNKENLLVAVLLLLLLAVTVAVAV